jgi:outer membrane protein OmpA-like peptidoglycan-associated protein
MEQINQLDKEIEDGRKNQLDVMAPAWFGKAETSLNEARKGLEQGDELSEIFEKVADGRAQLRRAEEMGQLVRTALTDVIKARDRARAAGAAELGEDYDKAEREFLKLTKAIENNNLYWAQKNRTKVIRTFDELELRAIKKDALGEARKLVNQGEKEGARKIAPQALQVAEKKLSDAESYISENRYQTEDIKKRSEEALFYARRLIQVMRQSEKVAAMQPEQIVLWFEGMLHKTAGALSAPDRRDESLETQVETVLKSVEALQQAHQSAVEKTKAQRSEITSMKEEIAALEGRRREVQFEKERLAQEKEDTTERLEAERGFQQLFSEVRRSFGPTEAEVYKQGNQLVIRLRAIQFPVGKAVILPGNYSLLSKVQRAIRSFGEPDVVIEGHTDSTGSDELNERLSQDRADAVREYFVANGTLNYEEIMAIGYGSKRPLASNATEEGRAINRRIDVLITPRPEGGR